MFTILSPRKTSPEGKIQNIWLWLFLKIVYTSNTNNLNFLFCSGFFLVGRMVNCNTCMVVAAWHLWVLPPENTVDYTKIMQQVNSEHNYLYFDIVIFSKICRSHPRDVEWPYQRQDEENYDCKLRHTGAGAQITGAQLRVGLYRDKICLILKFYRKTTKIIQCLSLTCNRKWLNRMVLV